MKKSGTTIELRDGESLRSWERRKANFKRRWNIRSFPCDLGICAICGEVKVIGCLHIATSDDSVTGSICRKCAVKIVNGCEWMIEASLRRKGEPCQQ